MSRTPQQPLGITLKLYLLHWFAKKNKNKRKKGEKKKKVAILNNPGLTESFRTGRTFEIRPLRSSSSWWARGIQCCISDWGALVLFFRIPENGMQVQGFSTSWWQDHDTVLPWGHHEDIRHLQRTGWHPGVADETS